MSQIQKDRKPPEQQTNTGDLGFVKPAMPDFIHDLGKDLFGDDKLNDKQKAKLAAMKKQGRLICYCGARGCSIGPMVEELEDGSPGEIPEE